MSYLLAKDEGGAHPRLAVVETIEDIMAHVAHGWRHAHTADVVWQAVPPDPNPADERQTAPMGDHRSGFMDMPEPDVQKMPVPETQVVHDKEI